MQFANDVWERALVLLEVGEEAPEHKGRAFVAAQMWLSLAAIEEQLAAWANQVEGETS
jgi:hypothetical protein